MLKTMKRILLALIVLLSIPALFSDNGTGQSNKEWRRSALNRPRRIFMNNDGNDPINCAAEVSKEGLLKKRTRALANTQVDVLSYCTFCAGFGNFTHFTKVGNIFTTTEPPFQTNKTKDFLAAGIDPLRTMIEFMHANNKECFWSMRMNDTHDGGRKPETQGPVLFRNNPLKQSHPEWLMGRPDEKPSRPSWSAVNYGVAEIRDLAFRFFEEVCQDYDVDGVEMDFFRHPVFFKATTDRKSVTQLERDQMTELMACIRKMTDAAGRKRGRPILVAVRVPDSAEYCKAIGLDIEKWLADDLIDILVMSGYFQINDWEYSVALAKKYGVKVYASLDESRVTDPIAMQRRKTDMAYRGRALNALDAGMDGVYLFNLFNPDRKIWNELHSPEIMKKLDRDYFASIRGERDAAGGNLSYKKFVTAELFEPNAARSIRPGKSETVRLRISEKLTEFQGAASKLHLMFAQSFDPQKITVIINGKKHDKKLSLKEAEKPAVANKHFKSGWEMVLDVDASQYQKGYNNVTVTLDESVRKPIVWSDIILEIRNPSSL
jgi:hypothetical protein